MPPTGPTASTQLVLPFREQSLAAGVDAPCEQWLRSWVCILPRETPTWAPGCHAGGCRSPSTPCRSLGVRPAGVGSGV